ncbi:MAG: hypothetical protein RR056_05865 [Acetivibrio sp.]
MKRCLTSNFILCGLCGWCFECFWTGLGAIRKKEDKRLICNTSIWMFPIYGSAALIEPISHLLKPFSFITRGVVYTAFIFLTEFFTGSWLRKRGACPWDYSDSSLNYKGLIRLDYAPLWFTMSLLYEKILSFSKKKR